jgi:hypothetical protein
MKDMSKCARQLEKISFFLLNFKYFREFVAKKKESGDSRENKNVWTICAKIFIFAKRNFLKFRQNMRNFAK